MPEIILENSADHDYYRTLIEAFPEDQSIQLILNQGLVLEKVEKKDINHHNDGEYFRGEQKKIDNSVTHQVLTKCGFINDWLFSDRRIIEKIRSHIKSYYIMLSSLGYDDERMQHVENSQVQNQTAMFDLALINNSMSSVFLTLTSIIIVFALLTHEFIICLCLLLLGCLLLRWFSRKQMFDSIDSIHEGNAYSINKLGLELYKFKTRYNRMISNIRDVEAVAKGYRLSGPRAPISRIEVQQGNASFHSMEQRKLLTKALTSIVKTMQSIIASLHSSSSVDWEEDVDQLDFTVHSIEHIKHLFHIFLKTEERLVSVLMSECLNGSNSSEDQLFQELTQSMINVLCGQIEHYNEKMQQRVKSTTSQLQFQIESTAYTNQTTDMISELTCKLALFQHACGSFNPNSEDLNLLQDSYDDINERFGDMVEQVNSLQQYVSVVGKGLLAAHLEQEKQRAFESMDTIAVPGRTRKKDDEGSSRKELQTTESAQIERYEIMNNARSNESTETEGTSTSTDSDILDVYECEVNKNKEEVFMPQHQFCLPSLPPSLLAKFKTVASTVNQQELSTNEEQTLNVNQPDVVTTETTRVMWKESGSKHQNHHHHFLGELHNVMNRRTQRQQINSSYHHHCRSHHHGPTINQVPRPPIDTSPIESHPRHRQGPLRL